MVDRFFLMFCSFDCFLLYNNYDYKYLILKNCNYVNVINDKLCKVR